MKNILEALMEEKNKGNFKAFILNKAYWYTYMRDI